MCHFAYRLESHRASFLVMFCFFLVTFIQQLYCELIASLNEWKKNNVYNWLLVY
jgi:hypothetical protein